MTARSSLLCLSLGGIQGSVLPEGKSSRFHGARETSGRRCDRHSDAVTLGRRIEVGSGGRKVSAQQHPSPKGGRASCLAEALAPRQVLPRVPGLGWARGRSWDGSSARGACRSRALVAAGTRTWCFLPERELPGHGVSSAGKGALCLLRGAGVPPGPSPRWADSVSVASAWRPVGAPLLLGHSPGGAEAAF